MGADELTTAVWDLDADEFPSDGAIEERAQFLLRYAIPAPSSHNSQPWRFTVVDNRIELAADETRWLEVATRINGNYSTVSAVPSRTSVSKPRTSVRY